MQALNIAACTIYMQTILPLQQQGEGRVQGIQRRQQSPAKEPARHADKTAVRCTSGAAREPPLQLWFFWGSSEAKCDWFYTPKPAAARRQRVEELSLARSCIAQAGLDIAVTTLEQTLVRSSRTQHIVSICNVLSFEADVVLREPDEKPDTRR